MIGLNATTKSLEVVLGGASAAPLQCVASWKVIQAADAQTADALVDTNGTTAVTLVAAPAASEGHLVDFLSIYNPNAAASTVTVQVDVSGTKYIIFRVSLAQYERLEYAEGRGWAVYTNTGAIKQSLNQGAAPVSVGWSSVVLASDVTNNNATANTLADVTGLSFAVTSGTRYWFEFFIRYTSAAATTGSRWSVNGPTTSELNYDSTYTLTTTTRTLNNNTAYDLPAASNATSVVAGNLATIRGILLPTANGTLIARFASEVASSAIVAKAGSYVRYIAV